MSCPCDKCCSGAINPFRCRCDQQFLCGGKTTHLIEQVEQGFAAFFRVCDPAQSHARGDDLGEDVGEPPRQGCEVEIVEWRRSRDKVYGDGIKHRRATPRYA